MRASRENALNEVIGKFFTLTQFSTDAEVEEEVKLLRGALNDFTGC